ncbi:ExbD/TolR family protein [Flexibacterium corallicola]|uniref:ExbD/TolR family protein n=1 Tax=Flexibacterium corallicola TaxID=3037259 RepID=UPI00286F65F5|nr:biopolymer transporter ExbD [Pseudovibrio sp. M1P-2-3]
MRLEARARKRRAPGLTSLIDVIFLLLMFFMLASTFSVYQRLDITSGTSGRGDIKQSPVLIRVGAEGKLDIGGQPMEFSLLEQRLADLDKERSIAVMPRTDANVQDVVLVLERLKALQLNATLVGQ